MLHPMHLHGYHFQVVAQDGFTLAVPYMADTLSSRPGSGSTRCGSEPARGLGLPLSHPAPRRGAGGHVRHGDRPDRRVSRARLVIRAERGDEGPAASSFDGRGRGRRRETEASACPPRRVLHLAAILLCVTLSRRIRPARSGTFGQGLREPAANTGNRRTERREVETMTERIRWQDALLVVGAHTYSPRSGSSTSRRTRTPRGRSGSSAARSPSSGLRPWCCRGSWPSSGSRSSPGSRCSSRPGSWGLTASRSLPGTHGSPDRSR